jgi:hypothetical protein
VDAFGRFDSRRNFFVTFALLVRLHRVGVDEEQSAVSTKRVAARRRRVVRFRPAVVVAVTDVDASMLDIWQVFVRLDIFEILDPTL